MLAGVVYDPMRDECWTAERGGPPMLDGVPVRRVGREDLATAMVATGFGYDAAVREQQGALVAGLLPQVRDIRRFGSAALDLAWTAAGRYDAYFERGVQALGRRRRRAAVRVRGARGPRARAVAAVRRPASLVASPALLAKLAPYVA